MMDTPLYIGGFGENGLQFSGVLDDLYVFDRELTKEEVVGCMNNVKNFPQIIANEASEEEIETAEAAFFQESGSVVGIKYCSGIRYSYNLSIPDFENVEEFAVILTFDGLNSQLAQQMANLHAKGKAPTSVVIGIGSGSLSPSLSEGFDYNTRQYSYDVFGSEFANFIVDELIPKLDKRYDLKISASPDMHMACGASSGGISAWNCVWFRNDYFRRVYMSSPTFAALNQGYMAPVLMRLTETKPIRGFMDYSQNEPNDYFGSSYCAALEAKMALDFAGYSFEYRYNEGANHCSHWQDDAGLYEAMEYVWEGWETTPIGVTKSTGYMNKIVSVQDGWKVVEVRMPNKCRGITTNGEYTFQGNKIYFTDAKGNRKMVSSDFSNITAVAVSSDLWRLYVSDSDVGCVYAMSVHEDGSLTNKMMMVSLYRSIDFDTPGALDLCVDIEDRIYAATELGIQVIRSYGPIDAIIPLPNNQIPDKIAFGGENNSYMYAQCGDTVYCRPWKISGRGSNDEIYEPVTRDYYNK